MSDRAGAPGAHRRRAPRPRLVRRRRPCHESEKLPIPVPNGVTVTLDGNTVTVKGPKGELDAHAAGRDDHRRRRTARSTVTRPSDEPQHKALHGLTRTLIANMVEGVTKGFQKHARDHRRRLQGGGAPVRAAARARLLAPDRVQGAAGHQAHRAEPTQIVVEGANKEMVGQVAAEIRSLRPPEPYKGKGVKYRASRSAGRPARREASNGQGSRIPKTRAEQRARRHLRVRKKVTGTARASAPGGVPLAQAHLRAARGRRRGSARSMTVTDARRRGEEAEKSRRGRQADRREGEGSRASRRSSSTVAGTSITAA